MKQIIKLVALATLLSGCQIIDDYVATPPAQPLPQKKPPIIVPPVEEKPEPPVVVELPPKQFTIKWDYAVNTLLHSLVSGVTLDSGNVLLIDSIKNNTHSYVQTQYLADLIDSSMRRMSTFTLMSKEELNRGKRALGLPADDKLVTRSKVLGLGRYLKADYVLSTSLNGNPKQPSVNMQLMTVNTGEIVWTKSESTSQVEVNTSDDSERIGE